MNGMSKNNKVCNVVWLKQPVENVKIRIKIKNRDGVSTLPTFDDYQNKSGDENLDKLTENKIIDYLFGWQEKVFSPWEVQRYSEEHNCITDTELIYYNIIKDLNYEPRNVFTYVHSDCNTVPLPFDNKKLDQNVENLTFCFDKLTLANRIFGIKRPSTSMRRLFKSEEYIEENEQWRIMQIVLDSSKYNEENKPIFMEEHILLTLYHNTHHNYLVVTPGENDIETNSYQVNGVPGFEYGVEIVMQEENGEDMTILIKSLLKKWDRKYKKQLTFSFPPLGKKMFFVSFEIVSAVDFDMDNAYIEYYIKIPDNMKTTGELRGRTHRAHFIENNKKKFWRYGHTVDLEMECATGIDPQPLKIYLEAISVDWWGRHRTEGYSHISLILQPGRYNELLTCLRPEERDQVVAESRRFFVGGCHLLKNLTILDNTQIEDPSFRYVSTGSIYVRWNVISQRPSPSRLPSTPHSSSSELLRGAEAVLRQYKKAKATLAIAAGLAMDGSGDG